MEPTSKTRCYVLDEGYRLILAPPPEPGDPLNLLYDAASPADALPREIDRIIRALTRGWERQSSPGEASARVHGMRLTVSPLHGPLGPHFGVLIRSEEPASECEAWRYEATA
jgi:hypothetical protein